MKIGLAITGASGTIYGLRVLEELAAREITVHLTISPNTRHVAKLELGVDIDMESGRISCIDDALYEWIIYHHHTHVGAAPASGSYGLDAVAIVPCSMGTMGRLASGTSESLIGRMGDVALKERCPLILVPRETPYSTIQLQNMLTLSQCGAVILPATPGFYHRPQQVSQLVDFIVQRILQHIGIDAKTLVGGGWGELDPVSTKTHLESDGSR